MCPIRSRELWSITDLRFNLEIFVFSAVIFASSISSEIPIERLYSLGFQNVAVGRINGVAALTGFYYKKMYGHFAGTKKSGRNNEVAVLTRWP